MMKGNASLMDEPMKYDKAELRDWISDHLRDVKRLAGAK